MKKLDALVITVVLAAAALGYCLWGGAGRKTGEMHAEIYIAGKLENTIGLPADDELFYVETEYGYNTVLLNKEGAKVTDADCPSLDCVHSPKITRPGQIIACLPHKVVVRLVGAENENGSGVDAVAG